MPAFMSSRNVEGISQIFSATAEEASDAYKDVSRVVDVVDKAGIGRKIAKLEPIVVING